jgi:hypothetical protein
MHINGAVMKRGKEVVLLGSEHRRIKVCMSRLQQEALNYS